MRISLLSPTKCFFRFLGVLSLFMLLLPTDRAAAQNRKKDAVYLKSGDVIFGKISTDKNPVGILISNDCGLWNFSIDEIDSITKYSKSTDYKFKTRGYYNISSMALLMGSGSNGFMPFTSLTTVNGYQWNQQLFAGIGLGFEYYEWSNLPLFAEIRVCLKPDVFTPYFSFKTGYSFPLSKNKVYDWNGNYADTFGGVLLSPEAGIRISFSEKSALLIGIGYHYQELSYEEPQYGWSSYEKKVFVHYNRVSMKVGFMFQ